MKILAIESSCDETSAAVVVSRSEIPLRGKKNSLNNIRVLSNVTATSLSLHAATGGIIPEFAAREQIKAIIPVITQALIRSQILAGGATGGPLTSARSKHAFASTSGGGEERQDPETPI